MEHIPAFIQRLIQKRLGGDITPEEKELLDEWYHSLSSPELEVLSDENEEQLSLRMKERLDASIRKERQDRVVVFRNKRVLLKAAAAVFFVCLSATAYFYYFLLSAKAGNKHISAVSKQNPAGDISPGGNKAILTLGNGRTIILDNDSGGVLGRQRDTKIIQIGNGLLQYRKEQGAAAPKEVVYNNLSTPRGGKYQVRLADGTNVWLNASSSIRFPVEFDDTTREVEITGEAYFEVAHNPAKPFRVKVRDSYIKVLGTHFDVMAYDNERSLNTTLLEGSLQVGNGKAARLLTPGEMAVASPSGSIRVVKDADTEEAIAWKNGQFLFNSADIHSVMRQVERWYDVDVNFERDIPLHFTGKMSRGVNVSELLRKLELTNTVHFRIEKNRITVLPQ